MNPLPPTQNLSDKTETLSASPPVTRTFIVDSMPTVPQTPQSLSNPLLLSESPFDRILRLAFERGMVDAQGVVIKRLGELSFPMLSQEQCCFLKKVLTKKIEVHPNKPGLPPLRIIPKVFLERVREDLRTQGRLKGTPRLMGGVARAAINTTYVKKIWRTVFPGANLEGLVPSFHEVLPDYDFAIPVDMKSISELEGITKSVVDALYSLHQEQQTVSREDVKSKGFQLLMPLWNGNHLLIAKIGNGEKRVELKLFGLLKRSCLFTIDAWEIDIDPLLSGGKGWPKLRCLIPGKSWQCFVDISARLIRAHDPETINEFGWPRMMMLITNKYRCLQPLLDEILWRNLAKEIPPCNLLQHLKRCLSNHFPDRRMFSRAYLINASIHLLKDQESIRYIWRQNDEDLSSPAIRDFLKKEKAGFQDVLFMLQLASMVQYVFGDPRVCITQHLGETHFQLMIKENDQEATILIPVNPSVIRDFQHRLMGLVEGTQNEFLQAFHRICREFNLMPFPLAPLMKERRKKLAMLNSSFEGLFDFIHEFKERCPARLLAPLLMLREGNTNNSILSLVPELIQLFPGKSVLEGLMKLEQREIVREAISSVHKKPPVTSEDLVRISIEWIERLLQSGDTKLLKSACFCWKRLLEKTEPQNLGMLSQTLTLEAAREDVGLGTRIVEFASRKKVWQAEPKLEIEALFAVLSFLVGKECGRFVNSDVIWLQSEKLRKRILQAIEGGRFFGEVFSDRVKRGILWMVRKYARTEDLEVGEKLLQTALDWQWFDTDREEYVQAQSTILRYRMKKEGSLSKSRVMRGPIIPIISIARKKWGIYEQKELFARLVEWEAFTPEILRILCQWFREEKALVDESCKGIAVWGTLLAALLNEPSDEDVSVAWERWRDNVLPLYLQSEHRPLDRKRVVELLQSILSKGTKINRKSVDQESFFLFLREGLQQHDLQSIRIGQLLEKNALCQKIDWNSLLSPYSLPQSIANTGKLERCGDIIRNWIDGGEVDLAESWLSCNGALPDSASCHEAILLKRLESDASLTSVERIVKAHREQVFSASERQKLWERVMRGFLQSGRDDYVKRGLALYRKFLPEEAASESSLLKMIPKFLQVVSKPKILDLDLFLYFMSRYPRTVSLNTNLWKQFLFSSVKGNRVDIGWKAFVKAPLEMFDEIDGHPQWLSFFCSLAVNHPQNLVGMVNDPKWQVWFLKSRGSEYGRQIILFVEYGLFLLRRKSDQEHAFKGIKEHLDKGMSSLSKEAYFQELERAKTALLREFGKWKDADRIYYALELMALGVHRQTKNVVKQCNALLKRAAKGVAKLESEKEKNDIFYSVLSLVSAVVEHDIHGFNFGRVYHLLMQCRDVKLIDQFEDVIRKTRRLAKNAEAERKYQEMLRTWSTGSGAKPKIVLFENAISDLGWQVVETSARMSLRNKVVKPALAFISGGLITLASIAVVEAIAQNFFGYD